MHASLEDLELLQRVLDQSYASAGAHLRTIVTVERRLDAAGVVAEMGSMRVMALATTTAQGEPRVRPVDGLFYRGHVLFGSGADSLRFRHLRARPAVSASVIDGERLQITMHGTAQEVVPTQEPELETFLVSVYGQQVWESWMRELPWARIEPDRMITFRNSATAEHQQA